jgi:molybdenum cofactor cytidylyltransferase
LWVAGTFGRDVDARPSQIEETQAPPAGGGGTRDVNAETDAAGLGGIVLAAGGSRRLGTPKQLLQLQGEPLVRRAARAAVEAGLWPAVVVVGHRCDEVRAALAGLPVVTAANPAFAEGMAGSIRLGLARLLECAPAARGVVLLACDQPAVAAPHLLALAAAARREGKPIAASTYAGAMGVPALFAAALFPALCALEGDAGARRLLAGDAARVATVPLTQGELDVDTPEDWARAVELARRER